MTATHPLPLGCEPLCHGCRHRSLSAEESRAAYLSCSAGTLARDLRDLEAGGLLVERLLPYDFFPLTHHVEVLALLGRR